MLRQAGALLIVWNVVVAVVLPVHAMIDPISFGPGVTSDQNLNGVLNPMFRGVIEDVIVPSPPPNIEVFRASYDGIDVGYRHAQINTACGTLWRDKPGDTLATRQISKIKIVWKDGIKRLDVHSEEQSLSRRVARIFPLDLKNPRVSDHRSDIYDPLLINPIDKNKSSLSVDQGLLGNIGADFCGIGRISSRSPHFMCGPPERYCEGADDYGRKSLNRRTVSIKSFSEMPEPDQENVVRGAIFLISVCALFCGFAYFCIRTRR